MKGYQKPYTELGTDYLFLDDASGYVSRHSFLAHKLPPDKLCERCSRPACWVAGMDDDKGEYDWTRAHHRLCLRCRDDWSDFTDEPEHQINKGRSNWEALFQEFIRTKQRRVKIGRLIRW